MSSGTANVGIKLSGSTVISPVPTSLGLIHRAVVPTVTAVTRSTIPRICQRIKLLRRLKFASFKAARGAVTPMTMSPQPAGNAKTPGRSPTVYSARNASPAILQDCTKVKTPGFKDNANCRNPADVANHTRNTTSGIKTTRSNASGGTSGSVLNRYKAEADIEKMKNAAI